MTNSNAISTRFSVGASEMTKRSVSYATPLETTKKILLVNPAFPIPAKSRNHKNYLPVGLLKIASWLRNEGYRIKLVYGEQPRKKLRFKPDEIWITSLFTYWAEYVRNSAEYYHDLFPKARLVVGGIYATLNPKDCKKQTKCDFVSFGVHDVAEKYYPDYARLNSDIDFQIVHASRGCIRKCQFCYTYVIEPDYYAKPSILSEIVESKGLKKSLESIESGEFKIKRKGLVFYDNNLLASNRIERLLEELIELKRQKKIQWCESQSGFDGRILLERPKLAKLLKRAGFRVPRIAWDWGYKQKRNIGKQVQILKKAGYQAKDIFVFMIYNWDIPFLEIERKRIQCFKWRVQISDCRFRPVKQLHDYYKPMKRGQSSAEYYIHEENGWDDYLVKQFRRNVRQQNICVRHGRTLYVKEFERMQVPKHIIMEISSIKSVKLKKRRLREMELSFWDPMKSRVPDGYSSKSAKPL